MITTKQRAKLKNLSHYIRVGVQIGKEGLTQTVIDQIDMVLQNKELIKVKTLQSAPVQAKDIIDQLADTLGAEPVLAVGRTLILYKYSTKAGIKHIDLN